MKDWITVGPMTPDTWAYMQREREWAKRQPKPIPPCPICEEPIEPIDCIEAKLFGHMPPAWVTLPDGTIAHKACADAEADAAGV